MSDHSGEAHFVVQRHDARTLHFDFRLERNDVYVTWAVPKGIPEDIGVRRLAIQVEDHSLDFGDFEGEIPEGKYGAGTIQVWDHGTYDLMEWSEDRIEVSLLGQRYVGCYALIRFRRKGEREWLLSKLAD